MVKPHLFSNLQSPFTQGLSLLIFATFSIQHSQVVQSGSHLKVTNSSQLMTKADNCVVLEYQYVSH